MIKGGQNQSVGAQMINASTGADFTGTVTVWITIDAGVQAIGSVGSGICTHEGKGFHTYRPSVAEVSGDVIAFTFTGTGALTVTREIPTISPAQAAALSSVSGPNLGMSLLDLITRGMQDLQVLQAGEVPSPEDAELCRVTLNDWIDSLATEHLSIYTNTRTVWTLTSAASYTIGTGATINTVRPVRPEDIVNVGYQDTSLTPVQERLLGPALTEDQYAGIAAKTFTALYPLGFYYNPTFGSSGFGTLTPYPIPTSTSLQGVIYSPTPISEFAALTNTVALPPGYRRFLRTNVAVELAPAFVGALVPPTLMQAATESKANIKRANYRLSDLSCGDAGRIFGGGGRSNIYLGP